MYILGSAFISFAAMVLLGMHLSPAVRRRIAGYAGWCDLLVHGAVIAAFLGTSTAGLLQAELAAIFFTIFLRLYRFLYGYERLGMNGWVRYAGALTKA